jgi:M6 family metalloprotease-like protein
VAVDFEGDRSESNPRIDLKERWQAVEGFWETMSGGKANIVFRFPDSYLDLPGTFDVYGISTPYNQFSTYEQNFFDYANEAIRLADPEIDFSDVDVVLVTAPTDIRNQVGTYVAEASMPNRPTKVVTKEKTIYNLLIRGGDQPANLDNWIHEFGHMLGLTDFGHDGPRDDAANSEKGFYDIMTAYRNRELYAWNRFLLGVADERHLDCKTDQESSTHWLKPIEDGLLTKKAVMIPLSKYEILIVESRRKQGLDSGLAETAEGAVVYRVDTRIGPPSNALKIVSPGSRSPVDIRNQQSLKLGESVSYGGWKIQVVDSGKFGDVVQISKS